MVRDDELLYPYDHVRVLRSASSSRSRTSICATDDHLPSTRSNDRRLHCQCRCHSLQTARTIVCDNVHEYRAVVGSVRQLFHPVCSLLLHVLHATRLNEQDQRSHGLRISHEMRPVDSWKGISSVRSMRTSLGAFAFSVLILNEKN